MTIVSFRIYLDGVSKGPNILSRIISKCLRDVLQSPTVSDTNKIFLKNKFVEASMNKEEVLKLIEQAVKDATAPLIKRIEELERQQEIDATDIKILKQGGNI